MRSAILGKQGRKGWYAVAGLAVLFVLCVGMPLAHAGEAAPAPEGETRSELAEELRWLEAEALVIEIPTVMGASRFAQKSVKAPASVSVVTRDQIRKYGFQTVRDILVSLRGFTSTTDRNYELMGVRGFDDPGDLNRKILVLVDGHRINDNIYDMGTVDWGLPLDVDLIQRVEVVRGPISALYGSNAYLALINIVTRTGDEIDAAEVSLTYGTFETTKTRFTYGKELDNGLDFVLSGTYYDTRGCDNLYYRVYDVAPEDGEPDHVTEQSRQCFAKLSYGDFTFEGSFGRKYNEDPTGAFWVDWNDRVENVDERWYLDLRYNHTFGEDWDVEARLFYDQYRFYWEGEYGGVPNIAKARGQWWGAEFVLTKPLSDKHTLTAGAELRDNYQQDLRSYDKGPYFEYSDIEEHNLVWALFAQDQWEVTDNLILNAGLRYDHYSTFGKTLNPRAALIYNPFPKTIVKLLYGEAFRAPSLHELYFEDGGLSSMANPDIEPETIRTYEAIVEQYLGRNYRLTLSGYHNNMDDLITSVPVGGGLSQYQNVGKVLANGVEVELEAVWENGVEGRISYEYREADDRGADDRAANSARQLCKFHLSVPVVENVFCSVQSLFVDHRPTFMGNEAGQYWITNLSILARELIESIELSVTVYNLFNQRYEDTATVDMQQDVLKQEGRTVWAQVVGRF